MRFFLLLSAMLTALCGVVSGAASAANNVEASISIGQQAAPASANHTERFVDDEGPRAVPFWHVAAAVNAIETRPIYADRRRE